MSIEASIFMLLSYFLCAVPLVKISFAEHGMYIENPLKSRARRFTLHQRGCNKSPTDKNIAQKIHPNIALQKVFEWILLFYGAIVCAICYLNLLLLQPLPATSEGSVSVPVLTFP